MKTFSTLILSLFSFLLQAQTWSQEAGLGYSYSRPSGNMGRVIERGHGVAAHYGFVLFQNRLAVGIDGSYAQYGRDKSRQEYTFDDGTSANMDIIVSNVFGTLMAYARWYPRKEEALLQPFLVTKAGYTGYTTRLTIYDPDDFDRCEPVDSELLLNDGTFAASAGVGAKVDFASVFRNMPKGLLFLETSINFLYGGHVRYMNADTHGPHHGSVANADVMTADFRNIDTQVIHKHHVGYVYRSRVEMAELRVAASMRLAR